MTKMQRISEALELAVIIERRRKVVNTMGKWMGRATGFEAAASSHDRRMIVASSEC